MQQLVQAAVTTHRSDIQGLMQAVVLSLKQEYPGLIEDWDGSRWVMNAAGGATVLRFILIWAFFANY